MGSYRLSPSARRDIHGIWAFIALDSLAAADRVFNSILEACELLAQNASLGHVIVAITLKPIRFWTLADFPNYIIAYPRCARAYKLHSRSTAPEPATNLQILIQKPLLR
jgi:plasmid stabilization system protein ParE